MPHTKTETVYHFDELSDRAKETARDWYRQGMETTDYADSVIEEASRLGLLIGINLNTRTAKLMGGGTRQEPQVYWSGFSSQGDGACFVGHYAYRRGSVKALATEAPEIWTCGGKTETSRSNAEINRIARELADVQRRHFYRITANTAQRGHYQHSGCMVVDVYCDGNEADEDTTETITQLLRDFADWIYRRIESEYEYQQSDEVVDENIRCNDYEFDEDGNCA